MTSHSPNGRNNRILVIIACILLSLSVWMSVSAHPTTTPDPEVSAECKLPHIENIGRGQFKLEDFPGAKTLIGKRIKWTGSQRHLHFDNVIETTWTDIETYVNYGDTRQFTGIFNDEVAHFGTIDEPNSNVSFIEIDLHTYDRLKIWPDHHPDELVVDLFGIELLTSTITFTAPYSGSYSIEATGATTQTVAGSFGFSEPCIEPPTTESLPTITSTSTSTDEPITATPTATPTPTGTSTATSEATVPTTSTPTATSTFTTEPDIPSTSTATSTATASTTPTSSPTPVATLVKSPETCTIAKEVRYNQPGSEQGILLVSPDKDVPLGSSISIIALLTSEFLAFDYLMINDTRIDSRSTTYIVETCDVTVTAFYQRRSTNLPITEEQVFSYWIWISMVSSED